MRGFAPSRLVLISITISAAVVRDMVAHARDEVPKECCGLLVGTTGAVVRSVRAGNLADGLTRYLINPEDHFAAIRSARDDGLQVVGAYHSHPLSAPVPSTTDIAEANSGADFLYVIVSPVSGDVRGYRITEGSVTACPLEISPG